MKLKLLSEWDYLGMKMPPMLTIPTCVAVDRFFRSTEKREGPVVFGYVGSLGRGYLAKELFTFFTIAGKHFPGSKLLIITKTDHAWLAEFASSKGVDLSRVEIKEVHHDQVPQEVWRMDVGLSFIEPHYSKTASCPTKLGEYLAAGVPIVANRGVGDVDALIEENRIGIVLDEFSLENIEQSLQNLKLVVRSQEVADRCVATAKKHFSLDIGIQRYHATYKEILNKVII